MNSIRDHRDDIIAIFTKSLDQCIEAEAERPGSVVKEFSADILFEMGGFEIRSRPALDFQNAIYMPPPV